ncbi:hypothetical protein OCU04_008833 [Sclerotinia nivalis]|uniref:Uncharacterized protein n=1 Tax=Sclerotinia nivalis TaxID=352851 RepID=A0A9X0AGC7_9HELO|nr:hypothetical protein OCU04_008833 [Sclerotinia nivalis]
MHSRHQVTPQNQAQNDEFGIDTADAWPQYHYPRRELGERQANTPVRARRNLQSTLHYPPQKQPENIKAAQIKTPLIAVTGNGHLRTPPGGYQMKNPKHFHDPIKTFDENILFPAVEQGDSRTNRTSEEYSQGYKKYFQGETSRSAAPRAGASRVAEAERQQRPKSHLVSKT